MADLGKLLVKIVGDSSKFERMLRTSEGKLANFAAKSVEFGKELTKFVTAPLIGLGIAAVRSVKGLEAGRLSRDLKMLKKDAAGLGQDFGKILIPPLRQLIAIVRTGIRWFKGLSKEQKQWIVGVAAGAAALGPFLVLLGTSIPLIGALVSGFISLFTVIIPAAFAFGVFVVKMALFAGLALVVVAGLALIVDAFLQMTTGVNLGLIDMVNDFKIGGTRISTWMTSVWLLVFKAWDFSKFKILSSWETLTFEIKDFLDGMLRDAVDIAKKISLAFIRMADIQTGGLFKEKFAMAATEAAGFFDSQLAKNLEKGEKRYQDYYTEIARLESNYQRDRVAMNKAISDLFDEDRRSKDKKLGGVVGSLLDKFKSIDFSGMLGEFKDLFKLPELKTDKAVAEASTKNFEQTSLRRFSLQPVVQQQQREQQVQARGVEERLDMLNDKAEQQLQLFRLAGAGSFVGALL